VFPSSAAIGGDNDDSHQLPASNVSHLEDIRSNNGIMTHVTAEFGPGGQVRCLGLEVCVGAQKMTRSTRSLSGEVAGQRLRKSMRAHAQLPVRSPPQIAAIATWYVSGIAT
jgi:hypothetical protein